MGAEPNNFPKALAAPRGAAIAGVVFAVLLIVALGIIRYSVPADPTESGTALTDPAIRNVLRMALNLIPFSGIAFLWFMGVLRNRLGAKEDQLLATAFLGSGLLFVVSLFIAAALAGSLLESIAEDKIRPGSDAYHHDRRPIYLLLNVFAFKMAGVFILSTSTIGLRTAFLPRWVALVGYGCALILLVWIMDWAEIGFLFPLWVLLVSVVVLVMEYQRQSEKTAQEQQARS
jgi:hypothetical protein